MKSNTDRWYRLDNQAKIFPEVYNRREPHTFRIQISLNEIVDPELLQETVNRMLERFPMYKVRLRRGLFWTFLEENDKPFFIEEMNDNVSSYIDFKENNEYLFRVFYHHTTIAVEAFHTLTDGTGLSEFVKALTFDYLKAKDYPVTPDNLIRTTTQKAINDESEDSSISYYSSKNKKRKKEKKAFRILGTPMREGDTKLISGIFDTNSIISLAKENNATVTQYIVAVMAYSIYKTKIQYKPKTFVSRNPMKIGVPVDLRRRFPSTTMRNFVNIIGVQIDTPHDDVTLLEILEQVKKELAFKTSKSELERIMSEYVAYEKNFIVRILPSIFKKIVLKIGYYMIGSSLNTMSLSNVGRVVLPESMDPYVNDVSFMVGAGRANSLNCAIISYNNKFKISFTSNIIETTIQKEFVRHFTNLGLDVELESNYLGENDEDM